MSVRTILVCEAQVPFVHGGAESHVRELVRELRWVQDGTDPSQVLQPPKPVRNRAHHQDATKRKQLLPLQ